MTDIRIQLPAEKYLEFTSRIDQALANLPPYTGPVSRFEELKSLFAADQAKPPDAAEAWLQLEIQSITNELFDLGILGSVIIDTVERFLRAKTTDLVLIMKLNYLVFQISEERAEASKTHEQMVAEVYDWFLYILSREISHPVVDLKRRGDFTIGEIQDILSAAFHETLSKVK